jgi:hypothetical protein
MQHPILSEELNKFRDELNKFLQETHNELMNKDKLEILTNKWQQYEEAKCDYLTGIIASVERRVSDVNKNLEERINTTHDNCTYRKMKGENFFEKGDSYVYERTKVAKWVVTLVAGVIVLMVGYNLSQITNKLDNIDRNFAQFRIDNARVIAELQLQAKVNAQGITDLESEHLRGVR